MRTELGRGALIAALAVGVGAGCDEKPAGPPPSRFESVARPSALDKARSFCDRTYPDATGAARAYLAPRTRPLEGAASGSGAKGWRWINAWATWCGPCVEEMGVLARWRDAFARDGLDVSFELLSVDAEDAQPELKRWVSRDLAGPVKWIRSEDDLGAWLDGLGVDRDSPIPIHALVDRSGQLRCVRVGAVHEQDFGAVRALLSER